MKRYLVFGGDQNYPGGGWDDFIGDYDDIFRAHEGLARSAKHYEWWHIVDSEMRKVVDHK